MLALMAEESLKRATLDDLNTNVCHKTVCLCFIGVLARWILQLFLNLLLTDTTAM